MIYGRKSVGAVPTCVVANLIKIAAGCKYLSLSKNQKTEIRCKIDINLIVFCVITFEKKIIKKKIFR
jgi:hypothetical protein